MTDRGNGPAVAGAVTGLLLGAAVLGPVLAPGYTLAYDLVFVPDPPVNDAALALDGAVPRAVPTDLLVALASTILPGDLVQAVVLLGALTLAAAGVGRLMPAVPAAVAGAAVAVWNPWVLERLGIGHWAFVFGYALIPWAVSGASAARDRHRLAPLVAALVAAAAAGAFSGLVVLATTLAVLLVPAGRPPAWRLAGLAAGVAALANAPWWVAAALRPGGIPADAAGVDAFAPQADTAFGLPASLLTTGGIWNPAVVPSGRDALVPSAVLLVVVALALVLAVPTLARRGLAGSLPGGRGLLLASSLGFVLALMSGWWITRPLLAWVVVTIPGGGLLRDAHKWLAPLVVLVAVALGLLAARLHERLCSTRAPAWTVVALAVLPSVLLVVLQPGGWWGLNGRLGSVAFPSSWSDLRLSLAEAPPGDVAALPWLLYRRFDWNADRVVLEPLPRYLDRRVLVDDTLPLREGSVAGEDPRSAAVTAAVADGSPLGQALSSAGVRFAVVHDGQPGTAATLEALADLPVLLRADDLTLIDLGPAAPGSTSAAPPAAAMAAAWGSAVLAFSLAALLALRERRRVT